MNFHTLSMKMKIKVIQWWKNKRMNESINKRMSERINERMTEKMNERKKDEVIWIVNLKNTGL